MSFSFSVGDKVRLAKEFLGLTVGKTYEVGNIYNASPVTVVIRNENTKVAIASISLVDFYDVFIPTKFRNKWTDWITFRTEGGTDLCYYKTNGTRVIVKAFGEKSRSSCFSTDRFNLYKGIQIAYERCHLKALKKIIDDSSKEYNATKSYLKTLTK